MRAYAGYLAGLGCLLLLAPLLHSDVSSWISSFASSFWRPAEVFEASFEDRHELYGFDLKDRAFYHKIVGAEGQSTSGSVELAQVLPRCGVLSSNAGKEPTGSALQNGHWFTTKDGYFFWEPAHCRLRRLSGPEARHCLSGRHIVFVGDSLTRYGYLNFVDFLSKNKYMLPYGNGPVPSLNDEHEFNNWDRFYAEGSQRLKEEAVNATVHESCNCQHGQVGPFHTSAFEDRQFSLKEQELHPTIKGLGLRLFQGEAYAWGEVVRVSYYLVYSAPSVEEAGIHALSHALKHLAATSTEPSAVIMNMGIWAREGRSLDEAREVFRRILRHGAQVRRAHGLHTRLLWKTTTHTIKNNDEERDWGQLSNMVRELTRDEPPWGVLDVRGMTKSAVRQGLNFYSFDQVHFHAVMYEQFNDLLLNMLCTPNGKFVSSNDLN